MRHNDTTVKTVKARITRSLILFVGSLGRTVFAVTVGVINVVASGQAIVVLFAASAVFAACVIAFSHICDCVIPFLAFVKKLTTFFIVDFLIIIAHTPVLVCGPAAQNTPHVR